MTKFAAFVPVFFVIVLGAARAFAQTAAVPAECQAMMTAGEKQFKTSSHSVITTTGIGPAASQTEMINIEGTMFVKVQDRWMRSPVNADQMIKQSKELMAKAKSYTCKQLPDEAVGGVAANVYTSRTETETGVTESHVWVGKSSGLPLKSEIEMNHGGKKSHVTVKYDYDNVKAPAGGN